MCKHSWRTTRRSLILGLLYLAISEASSFRLTEQKWERMHVIRRVYGPENAGVRRVVSEMEERMERYQTGVNGDPNHKVPYENHPFDPDVRRKLATSGNTTANLFKPIRIKFFTDALDSIRNATNAARIDWIKEKVLPTTAGFWSKALSVVPVSGKLRISPYELEDRMYCGDRDFTEVPSDHISDGVSYADLILYVSASDDPLYCPERTLAVAVPCNFDQFDRPTAGAVNVCLGNIKLNSDGTAIDAVFQDYVDVTIHEVGHVLGHSSNSYRFFWDPDTGEPRTERPFSSQTVTCVDGTQRTLVLPAENTLKFTVLDNGRRYANIVTPKVRAVARNQFNCQTLIGAKLEDQPTRPESCIGDHWDERLFYPEAMTAVISPTTNIMTSLTLALMEDSGWYRANYTMSKMSPWGLGAGCDFTSEPCLIKSSSGNPDIPSYSQGYFCNKGQEKGCSPELSTKLACTVIDYNYYVPQVLPSSEFQYFVDEPSKGGPRQIDYCPVYGSPYNNEEAYQLDCTDPNNKPSFYNTFSEVYDVDSKCIPSTTGEGLCYRTACIKDTMQLQINVLGEWKVCEYDFQEHSIRVGQGLYETSIICPRLSQACPDLFCPFNCAGRGVCNYNNTINGTMFPKCECFDKNDTSEACSDSMIPNGGFLDDSSGLFNNLEENFFDPLIAVFVDQPDSWNAASWAWAGGLIAVFLLLLVCICSSFLPDRSPPRKNAL